MPYQYMSCQVEIHRLSIVQVQVRILSIMKMETENSSKAPANSSLRVITDQKTVIFEED
jgi:hypothetical protein